MASGDSQARQSAPTFAARSAVVIAYLWRHGRVPNLGSPRLFTEWVQWRKLADRSPIHPVLMDKLTAKKLAADALGVTWTIPTLWSGANPLGMPRFAAEVMIKARHGCNQFARLSPDTPCAQRRRVTACAEGWVARRYGTYLQEWAYRDLPRGVLVEPFVGERGALPVDYKIYVFGGEATHVQVHLDRAGEHRWVLHDRDWRQLVPGADTPPPPSSLSAMLAAAETLAAGEDFLRVDFYEIGRRPLFGEFCLYPGSGLDPFAAPWIDVELGALWRHARNLASRAAPTSNTVTKVRAQRGAFAPASVATG